MIEDLLLPLVEERFVNDGKYREWHLRVVNAVEGRKVLGVRVPRMKALARDIAGREDAMQILDGFKTEYRTAPFSLAHEELMVWGLVINALKVDMDFRLELLRDFVPVMDNWYICDTFCADAKWAKGSDVPWDFLQPYWTSVREFEVRFAVVMSMTYLLDVQHFPEICANLEQIRFENILSSYIPVREIGNPRLPAGKGAVKGERPYYVNMAVAWLLATALAKMPEETRKFVSDSSLSDEIKRLYRRKARESRLTANQEV